MNLKEMQTQLLAALGACLAAAIFVGQAAATKVEDPGLSSQPAPAEQSVSWYLTDEYRPFMSPESANAEIENQRQLELASDEQFKAGDVIPYLSHGILTASDAAGLAQQRNTPDGYQPQLGVSELAVVADDGFDWTTTGFAASLIAAMLVVAAATFTYGNRRGYRSA